MIHFIRDSKNNTIVDIETTKDDISCAIDIRFYTLFLLKLDDSKKLEFMSDMDRISEIRSEWFETNPDFTSARAFIEFTCKKLAEKWDLGYVED